MGELHAKLKTKTRSEAEWPKNGHEAEPQNKRRSGGPGSGPKRDGQDQAMKRSQKTCREAENREPESVNDNNGTCDCLFLTLTCNL